jgi:cysteine desulfurase
MYFDYASTTPPNPEVLDTFDAVNRDFWANPESLHQPGVRAELLLEQARLQVLGLLGAQTGYRCVFTSGATESNNIAIVGAARQYKQRGRHIITSAVEHPSVMEVFRVLECEGWEVTVLPVNEQGTVDSVALQQALRPDTTLVSIMHVNNEIGSINDIHQLGQVVKEKSNAQFHVDAAQSVGKLPLSLKESPVDLLTFSAHKFFGLKGSGALIMKERLELRPLMQGGGQENGLRSGTADPARAAALAKALRLTMESMEEAAKRVVGFKARIVEAFAGIPETELNGSAEGASPFILNVSVGGIKPETILQALSDKGLFISTVSACAARKTIESAVVLALTRSHERAQSSIRISMSALTTQDEVDALCSTIGPGIEDLRLRR